MKNELHVVEWREAFRVVDDVGRVMAVCATREEADAFIIGQAEQPAGGRLISIEATMGGSGGAGIPF